MENQVVRGQAPKVTMLQRMEAAKNRTAAPKRGQPGVIAAAASPAAQVGVATLKNDNRPATPARPVSAGRPTHRRMPSHGSLSPAVVTPAPSPKVEEVRHSAPLKERPSPAANPSMVGAGAGAGAGAGVVERPKSVLHRRGSGQFTEDMLIAAANPVPGGAVGVVKGKVEDPNDMAKRLFEINLTHRYGGFEKLCASLETRKEGGFLIRVIVGPSLSRDHGNDFLKYVAEYNSKVPADKAVREIIMNSVVSPNTRIDVVLPTFLDSLKDTWASVPHLDKMGFAKGVSIGSNVKTLIKELNKSLAASGKTIKY